MSEKLTPSQYAREAAAKSYEDGGIKHSSLLSNIRAGVHDNIAVVQGFARFERDTLERAALVAEGIMDADGVRQYRNHGVSGQWIADRCAQAIRALGDK